MGNKYIANINPFQDILLESIVNGIDISHPSSQSDIFIMFSNIIENYLENEKDISLLDFDIINDNEYYQIIGKNIISCLWLSGLFPENPRYHSKSDTIIIEDTEYRYNKKTNKLTISPI